MHRHVNYLFGKLKLLLPPAAKCIRIHIRIRNSCNFFVCLCVCVLFTYSFFLWLLLGNRFMLKWSQSVLPQTWDFKSCRLKLQLWLRMWLTLSPPATEWWQFGRQNEWRTAIRTAGHFTYTSHTTRALKIKQKAELQAGGTKQQKENKANSLECEKWATQKWKITWKVTCGKFCQKKH